jgi:hypothetical protein
MSFSSFAIWKNQQHQQQYQQDFVFYIDPKLLQGAGWKMRLISSPFPSHPLLLPQPKTCDDMAITQHKRWQQLWILSLYNNVVTHTGKKLPPGKQKKKTSNWSRLFFLKTKPK